MTEMPARDEVYKVDALIAEDIEAYLHLHQNKGLLRFITCGSVAASLSIAPVSG